MVILEVAVQPLADVPVTVYVPGAAISTLELFPNPLLHEYVAAPTAVTFIIVVVHVSSVTPVLFDIVIVGKSDEAVTTICAVSEHPLLSVPVTV